jgi:peptide deformylase
VSFVIYPDPVLSATAKPRAVDEALLAWGERLLAATTEAKAYGLAAAHLGVAEPVVVVSVSEAQAARDYRVLYNPEVVAASEGRSPGAEGSVSLPGIEAPVERADWVDVAFDDADGQRQTMRLTGFAARVAQHEIDQMNGVFFLMRLSRLKRDTALRKFEKSRRG